ncbi:hypothetical protein HOK00_00745 [bacterium]|nr:hypothetical protein [bacterium]
MLFCTSCFDNQATFFNDSTKFQWCDNCVPRGCSCEEELLFYKSPQDFTNQYPQSCIKVIPLDEKNRKFIYDDKPIEIGDIFFSLAYNEYVKVIDFSNRKDSFKVFPIVGPNIQKFINEKDFQNNDFPKDFETFNLDHCNPRYYPLNGILDEGSSFDILISHYMLSDPFFHILKALFDSSFLFDNIEVDFEYKLFDFFSGETYLFDNLETEENYVLLRNNLKKEIIKQYETCNIDTQFKTKLYSNDLEELNEIIEAQNLNKLIELLFVTHTLNQDIQSNSINDSSIHWGCDCGCGGDLFEDSDYVQDLEDEDSKKRFSRFENIIKIWKILNNLK